jgi:hypothetical protein
MTQTRESDFNEILYVTPTKGEQLKLPFPRDPEGEKRNHLRWALKLRFMGDYDAYRARLDAALAAEEQGS